MQSQLFFTEKLPLDLFQQDCTVLIYDKILLKNKKSKIWIGKFSRSYGVKSGEKLKSIDQFPQHVKKILKLTEGLATREIKIVVFGGGSVGDFGGFIASILKRGVDLIHVPSTWLSAIDSAHGGKNGLNVSKIKNQVGTFYSASKIYLVKEVLSAQPKQRQHEAMGESVKIALIDGGTLWKKFKDRNISDFADLWLLLPDMIKAKYKVVKQDPTEKSGVRHILNFGHTLGHVFESQFKLPHGVAILYGLTFAIEWSLQRKYLSSKDYYAIRLSEVGRFLPDRMSLEILLKKLKDPMKYLLQDKKMSAQKTIRFVFLQSPGKAKVEPVTFVEIEKEIRRQML